MNLFHIVDDVQAITISRGIYRQVPVYHRGAFVYVKHGLGFIRLLTKPNTSTPNVSWRAIEEHPQIELTTGKFKAPLWKEDDAKEER